MSAGPGQGAEDPQGVKYPSPGGETMDAGPFYHTGAREPEQEHTDGHEPHLPDHVDLHTQDHEHGHDEMHQHNQADMHEPGHVEMHEHHGHGHGDLHAPEPTTPDHQHQLSRPANLEELQLAAQLGHGLSATPILPTTDPSMHVDDPSLRHIMPHPADPEQHDDTSYVHDTPTTEQLSQHPLHSAHASILSAQYAMSSSDGVPPRKRSKVSRACDECRRKKIKCDAINDTGDPPCSSCARSSLRCLFSRIPQKRGPSKGYIKELADRIHSIEHKLGSEPGSLNADDLEKLFSPGRSRSEEASRKRPFSSISTGDANPSSQQPRHTAWGSEHRPLQPAPPASADDQASASFSNGSLAPQPAAIGPEEATSKAAASGPDLSMLEAEDIPDIDEDALHDYLSNVQAVYPILPNSKERLQILLAQAPSSLRTAFSNALLALTHRGGDAKLASSLLNEWESNEAPVTEAANIVHAQSLLMLIIDADWRISSTLPFLLARAVALANSMKLWKFGSLETANELDSDNQLCIRIWWSLVLMDRWHAAGTGKPSQIPDSSVVAPPELENYVGEICHHLIRLSKLLNRISFVISTLEPGTSTAEPSMAAILNDYIENYREDLPAHIDPSSYPVVHLAYWHCRLLVTLLTPDATPAENMWPTKEMAGLLSAHPELRSPLLNHFASLVAMSLGKLARVDRSRDEATQLAKGIVESTGSVWETVRGRLAEQSQQQQQQQHNNQHQPQQHQHQQDARPTSSASAAEATASRGLQHLADLAATSAHDDGGGGDVGENDLSFGPSLAAGYLDIVV